MPLAPSAVAGLLLLRGQIPTVIDLRRRFGLPPRDPAAASIHLLVCAGDHAVASFLVDEMHDVTDVGRANTSELPAALPEHIRCCVRGVVRLPDRLPLLLSTEAMWDLAGDALAKPTDDATRSPEPEWSPVVTGL